MTVLTTERCHTQSKSSQPPLLELYGQFTDGKPKAQTLLYPLQILETKQGMSQAEKKKNKKPARVKIGETSGFTRLI